LEHILNAFVEDVKAPKAGISEAFRWPSHGEEAAYESLDPLPYLFEVVLL
jgi:hypothetical protein